MTLTQLRYVAAVVDAGLSITVASLEVHATQSGISKQLRNLERELGFELFVRQGRAFVSLTAHGETVLEVARVVMRETGKLRALT